MPLQLLIYLPGEPVRELVLTEHKSYVFGRGSECEVRLEDPRVSRRHGRLEPAESGWRLVDLSSKNGLSADGVRVGDGLILESRTWLSFGGLLVQCRLLSDEEHSRHTRRLRERWQESLSYRKRLDPSQGLQPLVDQLLRSIVDLSEAERGIVVLTRRDGGLAVASTLGLDPSEVQGDRFAGSVGAVHRALESGEPVSLSDALEDTQLGERPSVVRGDIRALLCLPLRVVDRVIGVVYADSRRPGTVFSDLDVEILSALASHTALAIAVGRIHREVEGVQEILEAKRVDELAGMWDRLLPRGQGLAAPDSERWTFGDSKSSKSRAQRKTGGLS
jgi:hypothetical protein